MSVDFLSPSFVHDLESRVQAARRVVSEAAPAEVEGGEAAYWEGVFEANAAAVLSRLGRVRLPAGRVVRYRFYGRRGGDLLVRPFVAGQSTDVETVRQLIDWHPPPDSLAPSERDRPTRDVEFLYRHFQFERSPQGVYEYWVTMQELWASARWIHSHVVADAEHLAQLTAGDGWEVVHPVERHEPAVVLEGEGARLAVLLFCRLERQSVTLQQIDVGSDQSIRCADPIPVAQGPRGYLM